MNIYLQKRRWKLILLLSAILIGSFTLWYTNQLTNQLKEGEHKKMEQWAEAVRIIAMPEIGSEAPIMNLINMVITNNTTIPVILVDHQDSIVTYNNIKAPNSNADKYLYKRLNKMKSEIEPIAIDLGDNVQQLLYYDDSILLNRLGWFPFIQLIIVSVFIFVAYLAFSGSRKAEQNQVWVGMAKETAHQLGTPTSSLLAWIDLLKMKTNDLPLVDEMKRDVERLRTITDRFSKIGAKPELMECNLNETLQSTIDYLKNRTSKHVKYSLKSTNNKTINAKFSPVLFEWVIENICKNAVDAMDGKGAIEINIEEKDKQVTIDIKDTGKGIPRAHLKTVFEPGFTTKQRGWGLGLTLVKRIIEQYHYGKIYVADSLPNVGSTFRIVLNN